MLVLHIRFLGDFALVYGDQPVTEVNSARLQSLFAYLVFHRRAPQIREHLAFLFWPDSTETQALNNLRKALHHLRQKLPDSEQFLSADAKTVQWRPEAPFTLDVLDFEQELAVTRTAADPADESALRLHLTSAIAVYSGDLLPNCYDDWLIAEREQLRDHFTTALSQLVSVLEAQGDYGAAIQFAHKQLRHEPLSEAAYRHLMQLHVLNGDRSNALRVYHACITALQTELGAQPSELTRQAHERLLNPVASSAPPTTRLLFKFPASAKLVGRKNEWKKLNEAWQAAAQGQPQCVIIAGEAGMGKSRLAEEFQAWAGQYDIVSAYARAYEAEGALAFAPIATWLRTDACRSHWKRLDAVWLTEISRVLPELQAELPSLPVPQPITDGWQRKQLFEALARAILAGRHPVLLTLDDLQWCDRETLEWLYYLMHFDLQAPLLLVGTLRSGEETNSVLSTLLLHLRVRQQVTEMELAALSRDETAELAQLVAEQPLPPGVAQTIFQDTEGNPLFVVEMVRAQTAIGAIAGTDHARDPSGASTPLPPKVQAMIQARLAQLSAAAASIVSVAATLGRDFTTDVLSLACDAEVEPNAFVRGLDELWVRRIVRDRSVDAYDFSHDRIRDVVIAGINPARRRLLHRRVAEALKSVHVDDLDSISGELAAHYDEAGAYEEAIPCYFRASQIAHGLLAHGDECVLLRKGLRAIARLPATSKRQDQRLSFLLALGYALTPLKGAGDSESKQSYEDALSLCQLPGHEEPLFRAQRGLWLHHQSLGQASLARDFAQKNLVLIGSTNDRVRIGEAERCFAMAEWMRGDVASACQHIEQAIRMNPPEHMMLQSDVMDLWHGTDHVNTSAIMFWLSGYPDQAIKRTEQGMAFNRTLRQPFAVVCALEYHAVVHFLLRRSAEAGRVADELIELSEKFGFPQNVDIGNLYRGWSLAACGQSQPGLTILKQGLAGCIKSQMLMMLTLYWAMLAQVQHDAGLTSEALSSLEQAFRLAERNDEYFWLAELYRVWGNFRLADGDSVEAAQDCYERALTISRQQCAKSLELRAAISLAQLWQRHGKYTKAHELLHSVYSWFTEGFDTADLKEAAALQAELKARL